MTFLSFFGLSEVKAIALEKIRGMIALDAVAYCDPTLQ
jgi:hypothetical protein